MVRRYLGFDDRYPVYVLSDERVGDDMPIEISEADYADYEEVCRRYDEWQARLYEWPRAAG